MGAVFCEDVGVQAEVFRSPEAAIAWLQRGGDRGTDAGASA
jgi:hypothetical protein